MIPTSWLEEARARLSPHIYRTPLTYDESLGIYLKWENRQVTGSFKARGAINKVLCLQPWEQARGLVAASAGNHGQGVALAGRLVSAPVVIFASNHAVPSKVEAMHRLGAQVHLVPGGYGEAEQAGLAYAESNRRTWISPYNDGQVIAGQSTLALETLESLPDLPELTWVVPVGSGGLISGIGEALNSCHNKEVQHYRLVGVQSTASPFFHTIYHTGDQSGVVELPSLADGLSGPVEAGSITIPIVRSRVDDIILVSEDEIVQAIAYAWEHYRERIEGSAAVALAAVITRKIAARPALVVISGGNIQPELHDEIINGHYSG